MALRPATKVLLITGSIALAARGLAACSSFDEAAPTSDVDGGLDGAAPDAPSAPEDSGVGRPPDGGTRCPRAFGQDFNDLEAGATPPNWNASTPTSGSSVVVSSPPDGGTLKNGTNALLATVTLPPLSNGATSLVREVQQSPVAASLDFDMQLLRVETYAELGCQLRFVQKSAAPYATTRYTLAAQPGSLVELAVDAFDHDAGKVADVPLVPIAPGTWRRYMLDLQIDPARTATGTITVSEAGKTLVSAPIPAIAIPAAADVVRVKCGIDHADDDATGDGGTTQVLIDNVELRTCTP